jgi:hypothetical protein
LPVALVPRVDEATRDTLIRLLAQLLASASIDPEARDERR